MKTSHFGWHYFRGQIMFCLEHWSALMRSGCTQKSNQTRVLSKRHASLLPTSSASSSNCIYFLFRFLVADLFIPATRFSVVTTSSEDTGSYAFLCNPSSRYDGKFWHNSILLKPDRRCWRSSIEELCASHADMMRRKWEATPNSCLQSWCESEI